MYAASTLKMRGHRVVWIMPSGSTSALLKGGIDTVVSWEDVIGSPGLVTRPQFQHRATSPPPPARADVPSNMNPTIFSPSLRSSQCVDSDTIQSLGEDRGMASVPSFLEHGSLETLVDPPSSDNNSDRDAVHLEQCLKHLNPSPEWHRRDLFQDTQAGNAVEDGHVGWDASVGSARTPSSSILQEPALIQEECTLYAEGNALPLQSVPASAMGGTQAESTSPNSTCQSTFAPDTSFEYSQTSSPWLSSASARSPSPLKSNRRNMEFDVRFSAMVECFRVKKSKDGTTRIRSSELAAMLLKREPQAYALAGVRKLKDYISLARSERIISSLRLGDHGDGWIEIDSRFYTVTSDQEGDVQTQTPPNLNTAPPDVPPSPVEFTSGRETPPQDPIVEGFPEQFITLYWLLRQCSPSSGPVLLSVLGSSIRTHDPNLYKREGLSGLLQYVEKAKSIGIVSLGGKSGSEWAQWVGPHPAL